MLSTFPPHPWMIPFSHSQVIPPSSPVFPAVPKPSWPHTTVCPPQVPPVLFTSNQQRDPVVQDEEKEEEEEGFNACLLDWIHTLILKSSTPVSHGLPKRCVVGRLHFNWSLESRCHYCHCHPSGITSLPTIFTPKTHLEISSSQFTGAW